MFRSFFLNGTAISAIPTLSLHDALPIWVRGWPPSTASKRWHRPVRASPPRRSRPSSRSEEHTSELQSHGQLVCRLLLEKKKKYKYTAASYCTAASSIADEFTSTTNH